MSEVWTYKKIFEVFRQDKERLLKDEEYKKTFVGFVEKWLKIKSESPLILKERDKWDDEIAVVVFMLKKIGEEEKFKEWYDFWRTIFGRDFDVIFEEKKIFLNWR
jgi:hypothetical protein